MKTSLLMDFSVDKANATVYVKREFGAPVARVWDAWTRHELLDQWWAPKPWKAETKIMDFSEGGRWLYAMVGPEGEKHWSTVDYTSISPVSNFKALNSFSDEMGNPNTDMPPSLWSVSFSEREGKTLVQVKISRDSLSDLQKIIEMGFKEGFTAALQNLDAMLEATG